MLVIYRLQNQGQTMTRAIVDIASSLSLEGVYVMLSRVSSKDVLIMRDFANSKLTRSFSPSGDIVGGGSAHRVWEELQRLEGIKL